MVRRLLWSILPSLWLVAPLPAVAEVTPQTCQGHSTTLIDAVAHGDFASAGRNFNSAVSHALPVEKLQPVWDQLQTRAGAYQRHSAPELQLVANRQLLVTHISFANMPLDALVAC